MFFSKGFFDEIEKRSISLSATGSTPGSRLGGRPVSMPKTNMMVGMSGTATPRIGIAQKSPTSMPIKAGLK